MKLTVIKQTLGLASVGLGVLAVAMPRRFSGAVGMSAQPEAVAAFGAREIAAGAGLLAPVKPSPFLWTRVLGDAMDLTGLARAFGKPGARRPLLAAAVVGVVGITILDIVIAREATAQHR